MHLIHRPVPIAVAALAFATLVLLLFIAQPWSTGTFAGDSRMQGDTDCDDDADSVDALWVLQDVAGIDNDAKCVQTAGDTDCSDDLEATDALHILRFTAGLPNEAPGSCTPVGDSLPAETPAPSQTPGLTPTPKGETPTPTGTGGLTPTPTATPTPTPTSTKPSGTVTPTPTPTPVPTVPPSPTPVPICYEPNDPGRASVPVAGAGGDPLPGDYTLQQFIPSFDAEADLPIEFQMIPGSADEAIVANQKTHEVWRVSISNAFTPVLYGDLSSIVPSGGSNEEGLLSVAFSPDFLMDDRIYIYFTNNSGQPTELGRLEVISKFIDTGTYDEIIQIPDTMNNHNGGRIVFREDGYLYLSLGDGGGSGDPGENAQDPLDLRGKVIRLDVSGDGPGYDIPPDNPFVNRPGMDEIWACGFRNPWRMSADSLTDDLWLGDVGQGDWEEVDRVTRGANYGWDCYEGFDTYEITASCPDSGLLTFPRAVYPNGNTNNQAVVGGFVYRGTAMPELYGWYVYADAYSGRIWAVDTAGSGAPVELRGEDLDLFPSSFGELPNGELVVVTFGDALFTLVNN